MPKINYSTGVYSWRNVINGKRYIGSTTRSFKARRQETVMLLLRGKCHNRHLQAAWDKYGAEHFVFTVLERCPRSKCIEREQWWIDHFKSTDPKKGYNLCPTAGGAFGYKHTPESIKRMSAAAKLRKMTIHGRASLAVARKAKWADPEFRKMMLEVHAKRNTNPVEKERLVEMNKKAVLARKGTHHTEETKKRISARTKEVMADPAYRARLRASSKKRWDRWRAEQAKK